MCCRVVFSMILDQRPFTVFLFSRYLKRIFQSLIFEMITRSILITGCNRGLGLELVRQLVRHPDAPECIFAACRNPDHAEVCHLSSLIFTTHPGLKLVLPLTYFSQMLHFYTPLKHWKTIRFFDVLSENGNLIWERSEVIEWLESIEKTLITMFNLFKVSYQGLIQQ